MAKIVQVLTRPSKEYDLPTAEAQVRDLDAIVEKLNTTFQEELKDEVEAFNFFTIMANSFINKKVDLTTTDLTVLYTVPSFKSAVVKSLLVSEDAGSGSTITITLVNASGTIFNLFKDKAIASKATTELLTQPLVMEESEVLKVQAADANELHVIASILEIQPREVTT